jgi:hypothetical protein
MRSEHAAAVGTGQVTAAPITGLRRGALLGYRWALLAFLLAGVAQIFLAGLDAFSLQDQGLAAAGDSAFAPHRALGFSMAGIALLILVLAVIARPGARAVAGPAVLVVLTSLMQSLLAGLGRTTRSMARCTPSTGCSSSASRPACTSGHDGASRRSARVTRSRRATGWPRPAAPSASAPRPGSAPP